MDETDDLPISNNPPSSDDDGRQIFIEAFTSALLHHQTSSSTTNAPSLLLPVEYFDQRQNSPAIAPARRRNPRANPPEEPATIPPPYPWAGDRRCRVCTLAYLHSQKMEYISGQVHCDKCDGTYEIHYNLGEKFNEITDFVYKNNEEMRERAHKEWMNPVRLNCQQCKEENCVSPVIPKEKEKINWLFLVLGQMVGFCSLEELKYFCKHTGNYLIGPKDAVLYRVYLELCRQLDPTEPLRDALFD